MFLLVNPVIEEVKSNLTYSITFLIGVIWTLYKSGLLKNSLEYYKKITHYFQDAKDYKGVVIPTTFTLFVPFFLQNLVEQIYHSGKLLQFSAFSLSIIIAFLSFFLAQAGLSYRRYKEKKELARSFLSSIFIEMEANINNLIRNHDVIFTELIMIKGGRYRLTPLIPLQNHSIDLVLRNSPDILVKRDLLQSMTTIFRLIDEANSKSRIRESLWSSVNITYALSESMSKRRGILQSLKELDDDILLTFRFLNSSIVQEIDKIKDLIDER